MNQKKELNELIFKYLSIFFKFFKLKIFKLIGNTIAFMIYITFIVKHEIHEDLIYIYIYIYKCAPIARILKYIGQYQIYHVQKKCLKLFSIIS